MFMHTLTRFAFRIASMAALLLAATIASAEAKNNVGWAWAGCPSCYNAYTPKKAYSYNSAGGAIKIVPRATGVYWVEFDSLYDGAPDNAQVTAYLTNGYCEAGNWGPHTPKSKQVLVTVWCWDANGNSANQIFSVLYQSRSAPLGDATKGIAFVLADPYQNTTYTPTDQYNSTGMTNTVVHIGVGNYRVILPGLTKTFDRAGGDVPGDSL